MSYPCLKILNFNKYICSDNGENDLYNENRTKRLPYQHMFKTPPSLKYSKHLLISHHVGNMFNLKRNMYIFIDRNTSIQNSSLLTKTDTLNIVSNGIVNQHQTKPNSLIYVGQLAGCFGPPHRGHYEYIKKACLDYNLNYLFIKTNNRENPASSRTVFHWYFQ